MIWLKIVKIKMIMGMLALSSLCLGQDLNSKEYNDLLMAVQQCDFNKFENLYYQNKVSENEQKKLQEIVQELVESEKNKWPKDSWDDISKCSTEDIDVVLKFLYKIEFGGIVILAIESLFFLYPYIKLKNCSIALKNLQNCITPIAHNTTAAYEATKIDVKKRYWISHSKENFAAWSLVALIGTLLLRWPIKKVNQLSLIYKRWKNVVEIKRLLESSPNAVFLS